VDVDQVIARWAEQEPAIRARLIAPGTAHKEQIAGRTAMELFRGIFDGELPPAPVGDPLDFLAVHVEPGVAVFRGRPHRRHYNPSSFVHGGWFATPLDRPSAALCTRLWQQAKDSRLWNSRSTWFEP